MASRTALVTGAQRGIGFAIAQNFFDQGHNVVLCDLDAQAVLSAARSLDPTQKRVYAAQCDVRDEGAVTAMVEKVHEKFGGLEILVNNAGISPKHNGKRLTIEKMSLAEWRDVLDVNLTGAFLCSRAVLAHMKHSRWGRIVSISSQAARTASVIAGAHYAASKAGMLSLSRSLAAEVAPHGITVNCIAPGRISTPMANEAGEQANAEYLKRIPVNRLGTPGDVASAVAFFASEQASFVTGVVLDVNGGALMI